MATNKKAAVKKAAAANTGNEPADTGITIDVQFKMGKGSLTAALFRNGKKIDTETTTKSGSINFPAGQTNDIISVNGSCSGTGSITIQTATNPTTPVKFSAIIHQIFIVL